MTPPTFLELLKLTAELIGEHPLGVTQATFCGLLAQFLTAHTLGGHHDRLAERAERWKRGTEPVPGLGSFRGRVLSLRDPALDPPMLRPGDMGVVDRRTAVVEVVRTQRLIGKNRWRDVGVSSRADPFHLELSDGHELEVLPTKTSLSGFEETSGDTQFLREVRSAVYPDEEVWITGFLERAPKGMGAYRGSGGAARKLRAPRGGTLLITREPPAEEWRRLARAHRIGGWAALVALVTAAAAAYRDVLGPWLSNGPGAMPNLTKGVVIAWLILFTAAPIIWLMRVRAARRAWARRFPWL
jgi:hypothetical protein